MALLKFARILWKATKPTIVLTDSKSVTRFFQTKAILPALWNACDYELQVNFKIAPIAGSDNTAFDFLSRLELKVTEKIRLKIREDIQTRPIEMTTSSSDVALMENNFSPKKQTTTTSQKKKTLNGRNNRDKMQSNGQQLKTHPP